MANGRFVIIEFAKSMSEHDVLSAVTHGFRKAKETSTKLTEVLEAKAVPLGWVKNPQEKCSDSRSKSRHVARHYAEEMVKAILSPSTESPEAVKIKSLEEENAKLKDEVKKLQLEMAKMKESPKDEDSHKGVQRDGQNTNW